MGNLQKKRVAKGLSNYKYGFKTDTKSVFKSEKGLNEDIIRKISAFKKEPKWMLDFRLKAFKIFKSKPMPEWGPDLSGIDFDNIHYYIKPSDRPMRDWEDVPAEIKDTFEKLGVPETERKFLAGSAAQFDSEMIYHKLKENLESQGIIFEGIDDALQNHPDLFREYFASVVPPGDNKFAALNSAVWSGGSFIYVPKGVHVGLPLQAYFRINAQNMGQFERTLIIADEGSSVHYNEGCTAPIYSTDSIHAAVVEIIVKKGAKVQYTTVQNWSLNVYNLVTKRAKAFADASMVWLDCNLGSKLTMKYPAVFLMEKGAKAEIHSIAFAGKGQVQDAGSKVVHLADDTSSVVNSRSISLEGGRSSYRGLVKGIPGVTNVHSKVVCDALILDGDSRSDTYPIMDVIGDDLTIEHEATVSKIGEEQLFYLMSRGLSEQEAAAMIVNGFINPIVKRLPMEYAVEMDRLVELTLKAG
jgi:Fe-S cluster assembly protein SufB